MATESKKKTEKKVSFWDRVKNFFKGIRSELKKVSWPDKKRLKQNVGAVLMIVLVAAVLIFIFDWLVGLFLDVTGFYNIKPAGADTAIESTLEEVEDVTDTAGDEVVNNESEDADGGN